MYIIQRTHSVLVCVGNGYNHNTISITYFPTHWIAFIQHNLYYTSFNKSLIKHRRRKNICYNVFILLLDTLCTIGC